MLELIQGLWNSVTDLLAHPGVRVLTTILAIGSAMLGLLAARKAQKVLHTHEQQILVTQQQSLNQQWQRINAAIMSNENILRMTGHVVGADDIELLRRHTLFQILVNLLFQAWASRTSRTLSEEIYNAHFASVAYYFRNRADLFFSIAEDRDYTTGFIEDCKRRFEKLKPLTRAEMGRWIRDFALLEQAGP